MPIKKAYNVEFGCFSVTCTCPYDTCQSENEIDYLEVSQVGTTIKYVCTCCWKGFFVEIPDDILEGVDI